MAFTGNVQNVVLPSPKNLPTIGGLFWGPLGINPPTNVTTAIDVNLKNLGFIAEDGLTEDESRPTQKIFAWGSDIVANPQQSYSLTVKFQLYEFLNPEVAKASYGDNNVTVTPATTVAGSRLSILQTSDVFNMKTWLWDSYSPGGKHVKKFYPQGQVVSKDAMKINHKEVLGHMLTVEFFPDTSGRFSYTVTDDGVLSAS